jgi:hypothetical protein
MEGYLGTTPVNIKKDESPYKNYTPKDWAFEYMFRYGQIDGAHHKQWVLDQVTRILHGTPIVLTLAKWENGTQEYRFTTGEPSQEYLDWVKDYREVDEEGEEQYSYDEGSPP